MILTLEHNIGPNSALCDPILIGGDLAPSLGGRKIIFADQIFEKISILTPKISDYLF